MIPSIVWWLGSVIASVCAVVLEAINRSGGYASFDQAILRTFPIILLLQYGLYCSFHGSPSLLMSWAVFNFTNIILRTGMSFYLGEPLNGLTWLGVALITAGVTAIRLAK